jgi:hypothetical protein
MSRWRRNQQLGDFPDIGVGSSHVCKSAIVRPYPAAMKIGAAPIATPDGETLWRRTAQSVQSKG